MKSAILSWCMVMLSAVSPAAADEKTKSALVDEMLALTGSDKMIAAVLEQQKSMMSQQMRDMIGGDDRTREHVREFEPALREWEDAVFEILGRALRWETLKPRFAAVYGELFSEPELRAIVAFYKTPAGRALLRSMPELMTRSMQISEKQVESVMPELQESAARLQEKIRRLSHEKPQ